MITCKNYEVFPNGCVGDGCPYLSVGELHCDCSDAVSGFYVTVSDGSAYIATTDSEDVWGDPFFTHNEALDMTSRINAMSEYLGIQLYNHHYS